MIVVDDDLSFADSRDAPMNEEVLLQPKMESKFTGAKFKMMILAISDGNLGGEFSILEHCEDFNGTKNKMANYYSTDYCHGRSLHPIGVKLYDATINNLTEIITKQQIIKSNGFIIMLNLAKKDPFENASKLVKKIDDSHKDKDVPKILVGTHVKEAAPKEAERLEKQGKKLAEKLGMKYFTIDAYRKADTGISGMLDDIFAQTYDSWIKHQIEGKPMKNQRLDAGKLKGKQK